MSKIDRARHEVEVALDRLSSLFVGPARLTFVARFPGNDEQDFLVTSDELRELARLIDRRMTPDERQQAATPAQAAGAPSEAFDAWWQERCEKGWLRTSDVAREAFAAGRALATPPAEGQAEPDEPTSEMLADGWLAASGKLDHPTLRHVYKTMRLAAPTGKAGADAPALPSVPVATLHDDGHFTWKTHAARDRYDSNMAGWRMDVYAQPVGEDDRRDAALRTLLDYATGRTEHAWKGECPDDMTPNHDLRDPNCRVCEAIVTIESAAIEKDRQDRSQGEAR